jgi:hypothetical protein
MMSFSVEHGTLLCPVPRQVLGHHGRMAQMRTELYPSWEYFPRNARAPEWVEPFIANVRAACS